MKLEYILPVIIGFGIIWNSCTKNPAKPDYQKEVAVYGYLWGNEPLNLDHAISIKYTQPITESYDADQAAIRNAMITLTDSSANESWQLHDSDAAPGFYFNEEITIQPSTTYLLTIDVDGKVITASTTVPPAITFTTDLNPDTINDEYQTDLGYKKPIFINCNCSDDVLILVDMYCDELLANAKYLYPFFGHEKPETPEEYEEGVNGEPRHIQAFVAYQDLFSSDYGRHAIYWYASMIVFYGRQTMQVIAIDKNFKQYSFDEHPAYSGGIKGGIGVFASVCGETYHLNILEE